MELMPLMINSACRLLWFAFLKVKTQCNKEHRPKIMFLYFHGITFLTLTTDPVMPQIPGYITYTVTLRFSLIIHHRYDGHLQSVSTAEKDSDVQGK